MLFKACLFLSRRKEIKCYLIYKYICANNLHSGFIHRNLEQHWDKMLRFMFLHTIVLSICSAPRHILAHYHDNLTRCICLCRILWGSDWPGRRGLDRSISMGSALDVCQIGRRSSYSNIRI